MAFQLTIVPKNHSSNKPNIPVKITTVGHKDEGTEEDGPIPFIDRLMMTLDVPTLEEGKDIRSAYFAAASDTSVYKGAKSTKGYKRAHRIALDSVADSKKWPHFEVSWNDDCLTRMRLDFIPVDLGEEGLKDLHVALSAIAPDGWAYFLLHGKITRLDVAVDLPNVWMNDFDPMPSQGVRTTTRSANGQLQTIELGTAKGSQIVIYDRKAKRIAKNQSWKGKEGTRVESRLRTNCGQLSQLASIPNPFSRISLIAKHFPMPPSEHSIGRWQMFRSTVKDIGLGPALALVPQKRRTQYRKHLKSCDTGLLNPSELWAHWQTYLKQSKIITLAAWL